MTFPVSTLSRRYKHKRKPHKLFASIPPTAPTRLCVLGLLPNGIKARRNTPPPDTKLWIPSPRSAAGPVPLSCWRHRRIDNGQPRNHRLWRRWRLRRQGPAPCGDSEKRSLVRPKLHPARRNNRRHGKTSPAIRRNFSWRRGDPGPRGLPFQWQKKRPPGWTRRTLERLSFFPRYENPLASGGAVLLLADPATICAGPTAGLIMED